MKTIPFPILTTGSSGAPAKDSGPSLIPENDVLPFGEEIAAAIGRLRVSEKIIAVEGDVEEAPLQEGEMRAPEAQSLTERKKQTISVGVNSDEESDHLHALLKEPDLTSHHSNVLSGNVEIPNPESESTEPDAESRSARSSATHASTFERPDIATDSSVTDAESSWSRVESNTPDVSQGEEPVSSPSTVQAKGGADQTRMGGTNTSVHVAENTTSPEAHTAISEPTDNPGQRHITTSGEPIEDVRIVSDREALSSGPAHELELDERRTQEQLRAGERTSSPSSRRYPQSVPPGAQSVLDDAPDAGNEPIVESVRRETPSSAPQVEVGCVDENSPAGISNVTPPPVHPEGDPPSRQTGTGGSMDETLPSGDVRAIDQSAGKTEDQDELATHQNSIRSEEVGSIEPDTDELDGLRRHPTADSVHIIRKSGVRDLFSGNHLDNNPASHSASESQRGELLDPAGAVQSTDPEISSQSADVSSTDASADPAVMILESESAEPASETIPHSDEIVEAVRPASQSELPTGDRTEAVRPTSSRGPVSAAWLKTLMENGIRLEASTDGWSSLTLQLGDDDGTMTIDARRQEDRVAVHVNFSDPTLRSTAAQHIDRLEEALRAQYETAVDLSLGDGSTSGREKGPSHERTLSPITSKLQSGAPVARASVPPLATGATHEWIG